MLITETHKDVPTQAGGDMSAFRRIESSLRLELIMTQESSSSTRLSPTTHKQSFLVSWYSQRSTKVRDALINQIQLTSCGCNLSSYTPTQHSTRVTCFQLELSGYECLSTELTSFSDRSRGTIRAPNRLARLHRRSPILVP